MKNSCLCRKLYDKFVKLLTRLLLGHLIRIFFDGNCQLDAKSWRAILMNENQFQGFHVSCYVWENYFPEVLPWMAWFNKTNFNKISLLFGLWKAILRSFRVLSFSHWIQIAQFFGNFFCLSIKSNLCYVRTLPGFKWRWCLRIKVVQKYFKSTKLNWGHDEQRSASKSHVDDKFACVSSTKFEFSRLLSELKEAQVHAAMVVMTEWTLFDLESAQNVIFIAQLCTSSVSLRIQKSS